MDERILILEDDADIAKVISKHLTTAGFEVRVVPEANSAIKEVREFKPQLIILDLVVPGGGGISVLDRMRNSIYTNEIPVIVLTGIDDDQCKEKVLEMGAQAYMIKPYNPKELMAEIKKALKKE